MKLQPISLDSLILGDVQYTKPYLIRTESGLHVAEAAKFDDVVYFVGDSCDYELNEVIEAAIIEDD